MGSGRLLGICIFTKLMPWRFRYSQPGTIRRLSFCHLRLCSQRNVGSDLSSVTLSGITLDTIHSCPFMHLVNKHWAPLTCQALFSVSRWDRHINKWVNTIKCHGFYKGRLVHCMFRGGWLRKSEKIVEEGTLRVNPEIGEVPAKWKKSMQAEETARAKARSCHASGFPMVPGGVWGQWGGWRGT